jgi:hypothetical protein
MDGVAWENNVNDVCLVDRSRLTPKRATLRDADKGRAAPVGSHTERTKRCQLCLWLSLRSAGLPRHSIRGTRRLRRSMGHPSLDKRT